MKTDHAEDCIVNLFHPLPPLVLISFLATLRRKMAHTYSDFYQDVLGDALLVELTVVK